jgi:hypothetical protein
MLLLASRHWQPSRPLCPNLTQPGKGRSSQTSASSRNVRSAVSGWVICKHTCEKTLHGMHACVTVHSTHFTSAKETAHSRLHTSRAQGNDSTFAGLWIYYLVHT